MDKGVLIHFYLQVSVEIHPAAGHKILRVLDIGANIGAETVRFLKLYPDAKIVCLEPWQRNFDYLKLNTAWAGERCECYLGALWHEEHRDLEVIDPGAASQTVRLGENQGKGGLGVVGWTLAQLIAKQGWDEVDVLKVDIEGAEREIFPNLDGELVKKIKCLIIEPHDILVPGSLTAVFEALRLAEFDCFLVGENIVAIRRGLGWNWTLS